MRSSCPIPDPWSLCVSPAHFRQQLTVAPREFEIVLLLLADRVLHGDQPAGTVDGQPQAVLQQQQQARQCHGHPLHRRAA